MTVYHFVPSRALVQEPRDGRAPHNKRYWLAPHYVFMSQLNAYVRITVTVKGRAAPLPNLAQRH